MVYLLETQIWPDHFLLFFFIILTMDPQVGKNIGGDLNFNFPFTDSTSQLKYAGGLWP